MHHLDIQTMVVFTALVPTVWTSATSPRSTCASDEASRKAHEFVSQLNTTEKIGLVTGGYTIPGPPCVGSVGAIPRLGFEGLGFSDGPAGYARADAVGVFASGITVAASWDRRLMYERAVAIGKEFRDEGAHFHLGWVMNYQSLALLQLNWRLVIALGLPRDLWVVTHAAGRNWESFGPGPYLAGVAMNVSVVGLQSVGVQACSKHYIGNEQETQRSSTITPNGTVIEAVSCNIDDRTLHELYLWPFANAVKAGTASVMCAYNRINGKYSCGSSEMMSILKDELAFPRYVVSDWFVTHGTADFANAGLDLEMPGIIEVAAPGQISYFGDGLLEAVNDDAVPNERLDGMAERVLRPYFLLGQDEDFPTVDPAGGAAFLVYQYGHNSPLAAQYPEIPARDIRRNHAELIREIGAAGTVLLKNVNGALPLKTQKEIGVFGNDASYPGIGSVFLDLEVSEGYEDGTIDIGGRSGTVRHTHLVTPLEAIQKKVDELGGHLQIFLDNTELADGRLRTIYPVPEVCLLFLKAFASEGFDRPSLLLAWNATEAVESTAAVCPNTVVVVHGPGVVLMPWADNENVIAILSAYYPGEETGNFITDVLWGLVEPSGRLPYTTPKTESDYGPAIFNLTEVPADPSTWQADFEEGQMIDYLHFDNNDIEPLHEFGFGLSYTEFDMGNDLRVNITSGLTAHPNESKGIAPGGLKDLWEQVASLTVSLKNVGMSPGFAVPQLYVSLPQDGTPEGTPIKSLRGSDKVRLEVGETRGIEFKLQRRDLSFWNVERQGWVVPEGTFTFAAGFSSRDLKAEAKMAVLD